MDKILIADDNRQIASILAEYAKKEGYEPIVVGDGLEAVKQFQVHQPSILLLDVMMPGQDGFEVCRQIRKVSNVPIIMITARGEDFEKIMGLEIGADDYMVKPFSPSEVMARIRAIMRRVSREQAASNCLIFQTLRIDLDDYSVHIGEEQVVLTKKEIEILWTLAENRNKVFSRDNLLSTVWGYDYFGDNRTVDSHIKRLRGKIDAYPHPEWDIKTIWGVGYKFEVVNG